MKPLLRATVLFLALTGVGIAWFTLIERWTLVDAIYMTVISITTVGFSEVNPPLASRTKIFISLYMVFGIGIFMYGAFQLGEWMIRSELTEWWRRRSMNQERESLKNHFIVCGCGRMGQLLCRELASAGMSFVAVERDRENLEICRQNGWMCLMGDATDDRTLLEAGVERATGLAAVLSNDADNLYVVLSSKLISRQLRVVARAFDEKGVEKMRKAGADQVVSVYGSGATRMAQLLTNPKLNDFFEMVAAGGLKLDLAKINVTPSMDCCNQPLSATDFRRRGIMIVGIQQVNGQLMLPPAAETIITAGDNLFALGDSRAIAQLQR